MSTTGTPRARTGLWILTAAVAVAFSGCGDSDSGGSVDPTEEQVQAQNNMADFMKNQKNKKGR